METNTQPSTNVQQSKRLLSLDILRGITVAGMILVNNGWGESFEMLGHSEWNGMTPCDLVFPFFLFIMGISCYLSLVKSEFKPTTAVIRRIIKRTVLLFLIGLFIHWLDGALDGEFGLSHLRIMAVLQRIALCYFAVSLFALFCNHRYTIPVVIVLLAFYSAILVFGNGYAYDADVNILAKFDLSVLGYDHIYHKGPVDPEGLLGTIPSIAHVLLGFYCGKLIRQKETIEQKVIALFVVGTILVIGGYLLSYGLPLNKRIWSPSYVLVTCGLAALLQGLIMFVVDFKHEDHRFVWLRGPFFVCKVFGMNALALYVVSELLSIVFGQFGIATAIYDVVHSVVSAPKWASLAYALTFVAINFIVGYVLYRKKIYIKL